MKEAHLKGNSRNKYKKKFKRRRNKIKNVYSGKENIQNMINIKTKVKEAITEDISFAYDSISAFKGTQNAKVENAESFDKISTSKFPFPHQSGEESIQSGLLKKRIKVRKMSNYKIKGKIQRKSKKINPETEKVKVSQKSKKRNKTPVVQR